jgi:energy-coupling factor transporter ATP-binding protein EcfA2
MTGTFAVQCKHTTNPTRAITVASCRDELEKAAALVKQGLADNYILLTNCVLSGESEASLRAAFLSKGVRAFTALGREWISAVIAESSRLRALVPRLYGLGDLTQILDQRARRQAQALLAAIKEDLSAFVPTGAYRRAVEALDRHRFVMILGDPGAGKSTIAALLAIYAAHHHGCGALRVYEPSESSFHWNPDEPKQFFWIDDAFGTNHYEEGRVYAWNQRLTTLNAAIKNGARIVMTSRNYIFERARPELRIAALPLLEDSQVIVNVQDLSRDERRHILYNNIRAGDHDRATRSRLKPFLESVTAASVFIPELARRLGKTRFTKTLEFTSEGLQRFFERPEEYLEEIIRGLAPGELAAIAFVFMRGGNAPTPVSLTESETTSLRRLGCQEGDVIRGLEALRGSLVRLDEGTSPPVWRLKHPTIADAFSKYVSKKPDLLDIYVSGASLGKILSEVTCGAKDLRGALELPAALRPILLQRLSPLPKRAFGDHATEEGELRGQILRFVKYRCDNEALAYLYSNVPMFIDGLFPFHKYMEWCDELTIMGHLAKEGILRETDRRRAVEEVFALMKRGTLDSGFLRTDAKHLLSDRDRRRLRHFIRREVIPALPTLVEHHCESYGPEHGPLSDYIRLLTQSLEDFAKCLQGARSSSHVERIAEAIAELEGRRDSMEDYDDPAPDRREGNPLATSQQADLPEPGDPSSLFDDIDEC